MRAANAPATRKMTGVPYSFRVAGRRQAKEPDELTGVSDSGEKAQPTHQQPER